VANLPRQPVRSVMTTEDPDVLARAIAQRTPLFSSAAYARDCTSRAVSPVWVCLALIAAAMRQREWTHDVWNVAERAGRTAEASLISSLLYIKATQPRLYLELLIASFPEMLDASLTASLTFLTTPAEFEPASTPVGSTEQVGAADLEAICAILVADLQCRTNLRLLGPILRAHSETHDRRAEDHPLDAALGLAVGRLDSSLSASISAAWGILERHLPGVMDRLVAAMAAADESISAVRDPNTADPYYFV